MSNTQDPMNRGGFFAFIFCMIASFALFIWVGIIYPGIDLKEVPEVAMSADGKPVVQKKIDLSKVTEPWKTSEDLVAHGAKAYKQYCAVCHGDTGLGDGPGGMTLNPRPRNLVEGVWTVGGDSVTLYKTLQNGIEGTSMVGFKAAIKPIERWAIVHWIRSVTKNKPKDDMKALESFAKSAD